MPSTLKSDLAAAALAIATLAAALHWGSTVAGGADSYGYVSEAGLWLQQRLAIEQDIVRASPWPLAVRTWTPLGYVPAVDGAAIVPLYPPGLPLLMAALQTAGGFCAAFLVVPVAGALTIWLTYRLGRRLFDAPTIALLGAALVAVSPAFLYQLMNPMSDVPAAAAWTAAALLVASDRPLGAGVAAAVALLVRPNLAPLALALLVWSIAARRGGIVRFGLVVAAGALAIAVFNARLYGSPLLSGYGAASDLYSIRHIPTNVRQFLMWTVETQTPLPLLSVLYFAAPTRMPRALVPRPRLLVGGLIVATLASYLCYEPFDAWWYLRFLLPMWPALMLTTAAATTWMVAAVRRKADTSSGYWVAVVFAAIAIVELRIAATRAAFEIGRAEERYVDVARFVRANTEPNAVVFSLQHSGTLRLYGDRLTLQFAELDAAWLDRAVAFLKAGGRHPYFVLAGGEEEMFKARFAGGNRLGRLDWPPVGVLASPRVAMFDAGDPERVRDPQTMVEMPPRSLWRCETPQIWPPRVRMK